MKAEIKVLIKKNYKNLTAEEIDEIVDKILVLLPNKKIKLSEIKVGEIFKYKGYEFTKLANEEESCYCLLNDSVFISEFGETNDWAKSLIRKRLNGFDNEGRNLCLRNIHESDLVSVSLNYYAYKIPNGRTEDKLTLLSWEEAYAYDFKNIEETAWLRSGFNYYADTAHVLNSSGSYDFSNTPTSYAVRPALHLKSDIEVEQ